jgi:SAM-dependent methyltransferase
MGLRQRFLGGMARQLGRPEGWRGRILARGLNRGNRSFVAAAVAATGLQPGDTGADIGFGGGVGLDLLTAEVGASGKVIGVDVSDTMVDRARRRFAEACAAGHMSIHQGSVLELPLADASVDGAVTVNTLYFVDDLTTAFAEIARVLRPGGRVVVGIGDPESMARMPVTAHGFRLRPPEEILAAMTAAGLVATRPEPFVEGERKGHLLTGSRAD